MSPVFQRGTVGDGEERAWLCQELWALCFGHTSFNTNLLLLILKMNVSTVHLYAIEARTA